MTQSNEAAPGRRSFCWGAIKVSTVATLALKSGLIGTLGAIAEGCGDSSKGGGGVPNNPPPTPGTTNVAAAIEAKVGSSNVERKPTSDGMKITKVINGSSVVAGENIVYTVNGSRDDGTKPEAKVVQTGDVIDLVDLINGSRTSVIVS